MKSLVEKFNTEVTRSFISRGIKLDYNDSFLHSHEMYELVYIANSAGKRFIGDNIEEFDFDEIAFLGPKMPHCWNITSKIHTKNELTSVPSAVVLHFEKEFFNKLIHTVPELINLQKIVQHAEKGLIFKMNDDQAKKYKRIFQQILKAKARPDEFVRIIKLLNSLTREKYETKASSGYVLGFNKNEFQRINKVFEFVESNFHKTIKISDLANTVHLTAPSFCRFFKQMTQKNFFQYLKEVRIGQACKLLIETEKSISQIYFECGYNTTTNFNKQFKEITHSTPKAYRTKYLE